MQKRSLPSFFGTNRTGDAHYEFAGSMKALAEAIGRDFGTGAGREYRLGGVALDQALLEEAARRHAAELYATQHRLGESLAKANEGARWGGGRS